MKQKEHQILLTVNDDMFGIAMKELSKKLWVEELAVNIQKKEK